MMLSALLQGFVTDLPPYAMPVAGLSLDHRQLVPGEVFIALQGTKAHGILYAQDAVVAGAIAVVYEPEGVDVLPKLAVPLIAVPNLANLLGEIAARFYQQPAKDLFVVGVTGTDGKTSVTHFISEALQVLGDKAAVLGTLGIGMPGRLQVATHTTPDAIRVQQHLHDLRQQDFTALAMEVSSHALDQGRVNAVPFHTAVLTNLTRDHLDYHGTVEAYAEAKRRLFFWPGLRQVVLNLDDAFGQSIWRDLQHTDVQLSAYGVGDVDNYPPRSVMAKQVRFTQAGIEAEIVTPVGAGLLRAPVLGQFNLHNLLATLAVLLGKGIGLDDALNALRQVKTVPGRMERVQGPVGAALTVVDYAHTPGALEQVLKAVRVHTTGRLLCVFGCGGDRDKGKRPLMAAVAERLADQVIVTDDNPRTESPASIFADIATGFAESAQLVFEHDRGKAIRWAIQQAGAGDTVLIAGKGHETVQILADRTVPFDDRAQASSALWESAA
ncbi:MAG: UDP-N-acetylmuramoyl-L-alanyl-D-glutamate--2,6-diaminopimelate ligase [Proteobacteria bacterium]|nr:MAG: UDP-N-acetylmuramoyl-L-alanyl-D-glutamate--2,6-diaminopimelate ligase [Pseudomonadota bacterium]